MDLDEVGFGISGVGLGVFVNESLNVFSGNICVGVAADV